MFVFIMNVFRKHVVKLLLTYLPLHCSDHWRFSYFSLMIGIVPKFAGTFEDMGATLPKPTLALMNASQFLIQYGVVLIAV